MEFHTVVCGTTNASIFACFPIYILTFSNLRYLCISYPISIKILCNTCNTGLRKTIKDVNLEIILKYGFISFKCNAVNNTE